MQLLKSGVCYCGLIWGFPFRNPRYGGEREDAGDGSRDQFPGGHHLRPTRGRRDRTGGGRVETEEQHNRRH